MPPTIRLTAIVAVVAVAFAAGTSLAGPPAPGETVTVTLANPEPRGRPASQIAERFARRVAIRSKGSLRVRIVYEAGRTTDSTSTKALEANLIRMVRTGKTQLAIVPNRAFQAEGVASFHALQTPFLITTDGQMARATTGSIAATLQSGLPDIGLRGLGLVPEGLRRPFGFEKALTTPADFKGVKIRAISSKATYGLIRALGAIPVDVNGLDFEDAVSNGTVRGAESSLRIAVDGLPARSYTASNIAFFPKIDALVASTDALARLTSDQRAILRNAAADARASTIATANERSAAAAYCKAGNTIVAAPPSALRSLRARAAALIDAARRDATTRKLIDLLGRQPRSTPSIPSCRPRANVSSRPPYTVTSTPPEGMYRLTHSAAYLRSAGMGPVEADANYGTLDWTLKGSSFTLRWSSPKNEQRPGLDGTPACQGKLTLVHGIVRIGEWTNKACGGKIGFVWKRVGNDIDLTVVEGSSSDRAWLTGRWQALA